MESLNIVETPLMESLYIGDPFNGGAKHWRPLWWSRYTLETSLLEALNIEDPFLHYILHLETLQWRRYTLENGDPFGGVAKYWKPL